ncbi:tRNA(Ile)-lysidine synthase [Roseivivax jejudonensis]|uniref:tRNA(Ile)-lysidine synthase n=1 Tax=Roseivivax jejudonensis TaxID=1529041 RepID=A0A1X7A1S5_9RHOB|nr:tRNA lysidine(34) synthetase TilS [Roseivivax jejudonensis]SLN67611.1 tRNA(Ile)-lysidine synthase [Roseivivax jejudonensis]
MTGRGDASLDDAFATEMGHHLGPDFPEDIALAVSGGGDSMAMLALAHTWARVWGVRLWVVTVDHGLRPESAGEAEMVASECRLLGHPHATLRWRWDERGNVMDAARRARLSMIDRWRGGIRHVLMAHTAEDVAETFLMRLQRGAGIDGLSAMAASRRVIPNPEAPLPLDPAEVSGETPPGIWAPGFAVVRPLLRQRRDTLRHYIRTLKVPWVEDPTNADPAYDRARMRRVVATLADEGIGVPQLAGAATRLARARTALDHGVAELAEIAMRSAHPGTLCFARAPVEAAPRESQARLLAAALRWVSGADYKPRGVPLEDLLDRVLAGGRGTLHGCEVACLPEEIAIWRDAGAVRDLSTPAGDTLWDGRWRVVVAEDRDLSGLEVRALGEAGWAALPAERRAAPAVPPLRIARVLPALWSGARLAGFSPAGFGVPHRICDTCDAFTARLLSD